MNKPSNSILCKTLKEAIESKHTLKIFLTNGISLTTEIEAADKAFAQGYDAKSKGPMLINLSHIVSITVTTRDGKK